MATEAEVANLAAATIGTEDRLISLSEDTFVARTLKTVWDVERRATIRDGVWNFAVRRAGLPAQEGVPAAELYPWQFRYPLPADCLRFVEILGLVARDAYTLEGKAILCSISAPLYVRYARDVVEPALWDETFARAFAYRLALAAGPRISGSAFDMAGAQAKYDDAIGRAKQIDSLENPAEEAEDSSWITSRWGGDLYRRPGWEIV